MLHSTIQEKFRQVFSQDPILIKSPGRINLIGEHTDYNEGYVLPAAIDKSIFFGFAKNGTQTCRVFSFDYQKEETFHLKGIAPRSGGWINYVMGVVAQLQGEGIQLEGFNCVFGGDIPIGAGLSSSAALENGICFGLSELFELNLDRMKMVHLSLKAEHEFAGVNCGIMDQFASMMGKKNHAIRLDCRSLDYSYFPIELGTHQLLLCDTQVEHSLGETAYNTRREECEAGVDEIRHRYPQVNSLRDVSFEMLEEVKNVLQGKVYERCLYVLEENERLQNSCRFLGSGNLEAFGQEMYGSHNGLSRQYEVSCKELDFLVELTQVKAYVLGARMMGGGFGGCTLNLIKKAEKEHFIREFSKAYKEEFGIVLKIYEVEIEEGTHRIF